jgi:hypothetical protein
MGPPQDEVASLPGDGATAERSADGKTAKITFPAWVPLPVAREACVLWKLHEEGSPHRWKAEAQEMILRLAGHDDMRRVWRYVRRRDVRADRSHAWAKHLQFFGEMPTADADLNDVAARIIYYQAVMHVWHFLCCLSSVLKDDQSLSVKEQLENHLEGLERQTAWVRFLLDKGPFPEWANELRERLGFMETHAPCIKLQREHGKQLERFFAVQIGTAARRLYGELMPGIVAIIVNVGVDLEQGISAKNVRDWCLR